MRDDSGRGLGDDLILPVKMLWEFLIKPRTLPSVTVYVVFNPKWAGFQVIDGDSWVRLVVGWFCFFFGVLDIDDEMNKLTQRGAYLERSLKYFVDRDEKNKKKKRGGKG